MQVIKHWLITASLCLPTCISHSKQQPHMVEAAAWTVWPIPPIETDFITWPPSRCMHAVSMLSTVVHRDWPHNMAIISLLGVCGLRSFIETVFTTRPSSRCPDCMVYGRS